MQNSGGMTMPIAMQNTARTPHTGRWIPSRRFPPPQPRRWTISCAARRHSRGRGRQPTHPQSSPSRGASIAACEPCFPNLFQLADRRGPGEGACHRHVCEGSGDLAPFDRPKNHRIRKRRTTGLEKGERRPKNVCSPSAHAAVRRDDVREARDCCPARRPTQHVLLHHGQSV